MNDRRGLKRYRPTAPPAGMSRLRLLDELPDGRDAAGGRSGSDSAVSSARRTEFGGGVPSGRAAPKPRNPQGAAYRGRHRTARHLAPVSDHRRRFQSIDPIAGYSVNCDCRQRRTNPTPPKQARSAMGAIGVLGNPNRAPALLVRPARRPGPGAIRPRTTDPPDSEGFGEAKPLSAVRGAPSTDGEDNDSGGQRPVPAAG